MDTAQIKRLKRGEYPIDARLDLHGLRCEAAHDALREAVESAYHDGARCLLVITGKGMGGEGVLRGELPRWLSDLAPYILACETAQPKHGGGGAFYVLVKRKRSSAHE